MAEEKEAAQEGRPRRRWSVAESAAISALELRRVYYEGNFANLGPVDGQLTYVIMLLELLIGLLAASQGIGVGAVLNLMHELREQYVPRRGTSEGS